MTELFSIQTISFVVIFLGVANLIPGVIVFLRKEKRDVHTLYFLVSIVCAVWAISPALFTLTDSRVMAEAYISFFYLTGTVIELAIFYFSLAFTAKGRIPVSWVLFFALIPVLVFFLIISQDIFHFGLQNPNTIGWDYTVAFVPAVVITCFAVFQEAMICLVFFKYFSSSAGIYRYYRKRVLMLAIVAAGVPLLTNGILPLFMGNFAFFYVGPLLSVPAMFYLGYILIQSEQKDAKLFWVKVFFGLIVLVLGIGLFLSKNTTDFLFRAVLLVFQCITGSFLFWGVKKETESSEQIDDMMDEVKLKNEQLRSLNKRNSAFITTTANQLRDPLSGIRWHSASVLNGVYGEVPEHAREYVERILEASKRLIVIVDDFLSLRKIERKEMYYDFVLFDMKKLAKEVTEEMEKFASEYGSKLTLHDDDSDSYELTGDKGKLRQVISNLIDNAIKYSDGGPVDVTVERDGENVIVSVKDSGIGMAKEEADLLFQKFSRTTGAKKINTTGSGLGLYIAREMIEAHHGIIWAESAGEGEGSTFRFRVPMEVKKGLSERAAGK